MGQYQVVKHKGFSLIELMVAVVIVGILAAVAIPRYTKFVQRGYRADATRALITYAAKEERFFARNNTYTTDMTNIGSVNLADGRYTVAIVAGASGIASSYIITATATGAQLKDVECRSFSIDSVGRKTATKSGGVANNDCW